MARGIKRRSDGRYENAVFYDWVERARNMDNSQNFGKKISCYFDGSFKSEKKGGSIGYIVINQHTGEALHKWGKSVFCRNSFDAELRAFHQLLVHIRRDKGRSDRYREADVIIRGDNKPLIDIINGRGEMPNYDIASDVLKEYKILCEENNVEVVWIKREENRLAHSIAKCKNRAMQRFDFSEEMQELYKRLEYKGHMIHLLGNTYLVDILDQISEQIRVNNLISNKLLLMEHKKQYDRVEEESLWRIIDHYQGEEFSTIKNKVFKYEVESEYLVIEGVARKISKRNIMSAVSYLPIERPSDIKHIYGSSYIYAILTDKRIGLND